MEVQKSIEAAMDVDAGKDQKNNKTSKNSKNKNRKKFKEEKEADRNNKDKDKRRKGSDGENTNDDDDEMLFVRGASPARKGSGNETSSPARKNDKDADNARGKWFRSEQNSFFYW